MQDYAALKLKKQRQVLGKLLVEGWHPLEVALACGMQPEAIWVDTTPLPRWLMPHQSVIRPGEKWLKKLSTTDTPPPVIAVFPTPKPNLNIPWTQCATAPVTHANAYPLWVVLCGLQDPGNVGTLIRSAVAFGVTGLITTPNTAEVYSPKVIRASAGAVFQLPIWEGFSYEQLTQDAPESVEFWATTSHTAANVSVVSAYAVPFKPEGTVLLLGNEGQGLPEHLSETLPQCRWLTIPQVPEVESLNVAVSGSLLMGLAYQQRILAQNVKTA
jgi:RNA methyltransferase, TrmH family